MHKQVINFLRKLETKGENVMFVICNDKTRVPVKVWLEKEGQLESNCLEQAYHLSQLPF